MRHALTWAALMVLALWAAGANARSGTELITSFEPGQPAFTGDSLAVVGEHATDGDRALRLDTGYAVYEAAQDWTEYDYLKVDVHSDADTAVRLYVEVRDDKTEGYWTRVNYNTVVAPGSSTVTIPTNLYVGEKSRPGRRLDRANVTRLVFGVGRRAGGPLFFDNVRLEVDESAAAAQFEGLKAFDFGKAASPLMEGFTPFSDETTYDSERGYGLLGAKIWQAYDALQPEPLYQDFLCIESGGLAVDLPNGTYRVFMNIDSPSGFWGEVPAYRERRVLAEGDPVVADSMDYASFKNRYYRHWDTEDLPSDDVFEKYQETLYDEKVFDVEVTDGQLNLLFEGNRWTVSLSALVIYPVEKAEEGEAFLDFVRERRRFHFENAFHRILTSGTGAAFEPSEADRNRRMVVFARDYMQDVATNDRPKAGERVDVLSAAAFAGEMEPVTVSFLPLADLGHATLTVSDLASDTGVIPSSSVDVGWVSYRLSRMAMDGSSYTIAPRMVMPSTGVDMPKGLTRRFWLTVKVPEDATPGLYRGKVTLAPHDAEQISIPLAFKVHPGVLDSVDIPAGPWGHSINLPWLGSDSKTRAWNDAMARKSLKRLRDYGFTTFTGLPRIQYEGFVDGEPQFEFAAGDEQMRRAREAGFTMPVVNYTRFGGLNVYYQDPEAMAAAGFDDYSAFVEAVFSAIQDHADANDWLPVYWNLGDEPVGADVDRSIENARAYTTAFPDGPPYFTAATSFRGDDTDDPHYRLATALHVANLNSHDEAGIGLLHDAGTDWAFYNGGNRWTFGTYMYKAAKEFDMQFRVAWHWNVVAGDPYYALDCREDDYAWCNSTPDGRLVPSVQFERLREGLDDYRRLLTLARLAEEQGDAPEAAAAEKLIEDRMEAFKLGQRNHNAIFPHEDWFSFRRQVAEAIASLR